MTLRIVTDSTADLPESIRRELGIEMVSLNVHFGPDTFKDVVEISSDQFWQKLTTSPHHPKTSQPSPFDFVQIYEKVIADGGTEIVSIHISGPLSGTYNSAQIAADMIRDKHNVTVHLVDTRSVSLGVGLIAIEAARMARDGKSAAAITAWATAAAERMNVLFTLDTLEYLQKNGRIGKAAALLGGLLNFKPILEINKEGIVDRVDRVRGKAKVFPRVRELMAGRVAPGRTVKVGMLHAQAPAEAAAWLEAIKKEYKVVESTISDIGPVIAVNGGPGTIGIVFYEV